MQQTIAAHIKVIQPSFTVTPATIDYGSAAPGGYPLPVQHVTVSNPTSAPISGITVSMVGSTPPGVTFSPMTLVTVPANGSLDVSLELNVPNGATADGDYNFSFNFTK